MPLFDTVTDLKAQADVIRRRRYGVIEVVEGRLARVRLRPYPKLVSVWESRLLGRFWHRRLAGDRCWLYYNQPRAFPQFLTLQYVVSSREAAFTTFRTAVRLLDRIAEIKRSDAILCDASNARISDRLLARWGWVSHAPMPWRRNFIKRFEERTTDARIFPSPVIHAWDRSASSAADALLA